MNPDLLTVRSAPPAPEPAPWCAAHVSFDDGPIVAVLWWDDRPLSAQGARLKDEGGVIADAPLASDEDLPEPGWYWWVLGTERPWAYDPRIAVAEVEAVGPGTPAAALAALLAVLAEAPEPAFSYEQSVEAVGRMLPWCPAPEDIAAVIEGDESIGSGTVVDEGEGED